MNYKKPEIFPFGERAILINWEPIIDEKLLDFIILTKKHIQKNKVKSIVEITNTYSSLLIKYTDSINNIYDEISTLKTLISEVEVGFSSSKKIFHLPICYEHEFGLDLKEISATNQLEISEIIRLHSSKIYTLFFIGFLPGFLYLGGLDKSLFFPRKKSPRKRVEKGAVGIAGNQTGIYPQSSPGGWQIIGNCPLEMFEVRKKRPSIFSPGDKIKFHPVCREEHKNILHQVKTGKYQIKTGNYEA